MNNQRNDELKNNTMKLLARLNAPKAVQGNTDALKTEAPVSYTHLTLPTRS